MENKLKQRKGAILPNIKDYLISEISITDANRIYLSGSLPSKLYGLPKIHKERTPM